MSERLTTNAVPNPGSNEAIAKGCTCPVLDNGHGRGYYGQPGVFIFTEGCPLHWPPVLKRRVVTPSSAL